MDEIVKYMTGLKSNQFACEFATFFSISDEDLYSKDEISLSGYKVGDGIFSTAATFLETLR